MSNKERLQKVIAAAGIASRRASEELIRLGRVQVNGQVVMEQGVKVDPAVDDIRIDDVPLPKSPALTYILLHKPVGVLSTASDERGRKTVLDLVPSELRLYPVGRLDADSEGLILLTNDGDLTNHLTHPRYGHEREYRVLVHGRPSETALNQMRRGMILEDGPTGPAQVEVIGPVGWQREGLPLPGRDRVWLKIVIGEGRKHQVRRMCEVIGHPVERLIRVRMGPLRLGNLPAGKYRTLSAKEVKDLRSLIVKEPRNSRPDRRRSSHASRGFSRRKPTGSGDNPGRSEKAIKKDARR